MDNSNNRFDNNNIDISCNNDNPESIWYNAECSDITIQCNNHQYNDSCIVSNNGTDYVGGCQPTIQPTNVPSIIPTASPSSMPFNRPTNVQWVSDYKDILILKKF